jgi:autotransporter-associated beta strand protein
MTDDIPNSFLLNRLAFNAGAPAYSLTGNALDFRKATGSILPSIGMDTSSAVSIANSIVLTSDLTVGGAGTGNLTLNGSLSGGGRLTYAGAGTLTLGASTSYTGGTFVNSGTLALSGLSGVLPPGLNVTIGNGSGPAVLNANNLSNNSAAIAIGLLTLNGGGTFHAPGGLSAGTST